MPKPIRTALYLRVSTTDQTVENQVPDLERLAEQRGLTITGRYSESVSAMKTRPEFDRLIRDAHRGKLDVVLVWSLDRLHRFMVGALQTVLDLDRRGVQVVSMREPWLDTGGPVRSLLIAIFGWVAEQERLRIRDRTRAGLERARRRGGRLGRPVVVVDVGLVRRLRSEGASYRAIAQQLGVSVGRVHEAARAVVV